MFHNVSSYETHLFIKELGKKFDKDGIVVSEDMQKYITMNYNVKIKINPEKLTNKDGKEVCENIQLRFIENDRFGTAQKISFSLRISSVNVTKSAGNWGFGHIY